MENENREDESIKKSEKKYYDFISVAKRTEQSVYFISQHDKNIACELLLTKSDIVQNIIVCKSKKNADSLQEYLLSKGFKAKAAHGNHKPEVVQDTRRSYSVGETNILITTDTILKALEMKDVKQVISYDLALDPQDYFYRLRLVDEVGKSIVLVSSDEEKDFANLEFVMRTEVKENELDNFTPTAAPRKEKKRKKARHKKVKITKSTRYKDEEE